MAIVLAFSGGLDTSLCVPYLQETYDAPVRTVMVDTGDQLPDRTESSCRSISRSTSSPSERVTVLGPLQAAFERCCTCV